MPIQVAQEKLQADIYERVNTCNMLLHQVRQRRQVREELQRRLQQLQDAAMPDKRQQAQAQAICQLEKNIEKVLLKVHTGQKVTALYLAVRDVLRKVSSSPPCHRATCSPSRDKEVPQGQRWWDAPLPDQRGPPAPLHLLSQHGGPLGLTGVTCCGSLCPRSWPTCLRSWTSCARWPSCMVGSSRTWISWPWRPAKPLTEPR
ncbi:uncharacterized protein LOC130143842 [Falco biarmicus]|uniref:uncharacterized protein LOC130143842 n=1 Tax=Falco biarmicus TaxID=345155 RepID=UPI0024BD3903|nr:uncharacterized protein LOC130143842 [Falco biarmicus]